MPVVACLANFMMRRLIRDRTGRAVRWALDGNPARGNQAGQSLMLPGRSPRGTYHRRHFDGEPLLAWIRTRRAVSPLVTSLTGGSKPASVCTAAAGRR